jgi:hypothetical protein
MTSRGRGNETLANASLVRDRLPTSEGKSCLAVRLVGGEFESTTTSASRSRRERWRRDWQACMLADDEGGRQPIRVNHRASNSEQMFQLKEERPSGGAAAAIQSMAETSGKQGDFIESP